MPLLSGFLPIPLAMMIPFMGMQSLVIGKQFGEGFQFGKRKISAMTNDEFNKLTPAMIAQRSADELKAMIPSMQQSLQDMRVFQTFIVQELIATVKQLPNDIFGVGAPQDIQQGASNFQRNIEGQLGLREALGISEQGFLADLQKFYENQIKEEEFGTALGATGSGGSNNQQFIGPIQTGTLTTAADIQLQATIKSLSDKDFYSQHKAVMRGNGTLKFKSAWRREKAFRDSTTTKASGESTQSAITRTSTGQVQQEALLWQKVLSTFNTFTKKQTTKGLNNFLNTAKQWNRLMQSQRKYSSVIDTSSTLNKKPQKIRLKTSR